MACGCTRADGGIYEKHAQKIVAKEWVIIMKQCRILGALLAVLLLVLPLAGITGAAAGSDVSLKLQVQKYSGGQYVPVTELEPGSVFRVALVADSPIANIGGIRIKMGFNTDAVQLRAESTECLIQDPDGEFQHNVNGTSIIAIWDTTSENITAPAGEVMLFYFVAKSVGKQIEAAFTLEVPELFTADHQAISVTASGSTAIIKPVTIPAADLELYRKLETIVYPDSAEDIANAEAAFAKYTAAQVNAFRSGYPQEFNWYANARNEYNRLAGLAGIEAIEKEVQKFLNDNAAALAKTPDQLTLADQAAIEKLAKEYEALSSQAKVRITKQQKERIEQLKERMEQLLEEAQAIEDAKAEAEDYKKNYALLWTVKPEHIEENFDTLPTLISEAISIHDDLLSEYAQALLKPERAHLETLQKEVDRLVAHNEEEKKILEAIKAFQERWLSLLGLNMDTVAITDSRALELMIADIDAQPKNVQERLASRRQNAVNLLETIRIMIEESGGEQPGITLPEIPDPVPDTPGTDPGTQTPDPTPDPLPTVPNDEDPDVTEAAVKFISRKIPAIIPILGGILGVSILLLIFPVCVLIRSARRDEADMADGE